MGYFSHHCIIVIGDKDSLNKIQKVAKDVFDPRMVFLSPVMASPANGIRSLYVAPDGSKEGWDTSEEYNKKRETFYKRIESFMDFVDVAEIQMPEEGHYSVRNVGYGMIP